MIPGAAPTILEPPASATPAAAPAVPGTPGAAAFDAILMLQNVAATPECGEPEELLPADTDDDEGDEFDASLEFLSELMAVAVPVDPQRQFQGGSQSEQPAEERPSPPAAAKENAFVELAKAVLTTAESHDVALTPATMGPTSAAPETLEAVISEPVQQNLTRGAEWLAPSPRPQSSPELPATLNTPVRDPRWPDELGTRVSLLLRAGESTATLQLTPLDLGPVEVNVTVRESQATIHFGASQAETRALLEASLPRLRELLASQGFNLTDASVSSGFSRSPQPGSGPARAASEAETSITEARPLRALSLLDVYA